ncbi:MAG: PIG-L deacetylase family protein, partial [Candidatus Eisenbacteria bacterium]
VAELLRARGVGVRIADPESFHREPDRYPVAVAAGLIEYDPWDRWALQRLHGAIAEDGRLLLAAPLLVSAATAMEPEFVLRWVEKQLRKRVGHGATPAPFHGRKYAPASLERMLRRLGYEVVRSWRAGPGHLLTECRRLPSMAGLDPARPFPDPAVALPEFEREQAGVIAIRNAWSARHLRQGAGPVRLLEPEHYRGRVALVLAPHPDDEIIGCGGTLARLIEAGARVIQVQATDGSDSAAFASVSEDTRRTLRLEEAARVAAAIGFADTIFWREDNRRFRHTPEAVDRLVAVLERSRPALVFIPFVTDIHPDHLTLEHILADALDRAPGVAADAEVLNYEVWSMVPANVCCDVTNWMALQERLLLMYETALKVDDYVHFVEEHKWFNSRVHLGRDGFADAYVAVPAARYPEWWRAGRPTHDA